jgi:hypothetical protein
MSPKVIGPALAKTRGEALLRGGQRVKASDAKWREMFDAADAVSEGQAKVESQGSVWYGTTSLILRMPHADERERAFIAALAARDIHVRVRAIRIARREAQSRAPGRLGVSRCEIRVSEVGGGVRIDVDVQAPLIATLRGATDRAR